MQCAIEKEREKKKSVFSPENISIDRLTTITSRKAERPVKDPNNRFRKTEVQPGNYMKTIFACFAITTLTRGQVDVFHPRYLRTQLSGEVVIVQPGHFNCSAVLLPIHKPRNGFTISTDLYPTSLRWGGEAACLPSACCYWMILLTRQQLTNQAAGGHFEPLGNHRLITHPETRMVSPSRLSNPVYCRWVLFPFASAVYAFIMFDFRVRKCRPAQKPNLG